MKNSFVQAIKNRRSFYSIGNQVEITDNALRDILETALHYVPSAFNSRTTRIVLLTKENHTALWQIVKDSLRAIVPAEAFSQSESKIDGCFASGYATILFFEDTSVVEELQKQFPSYAERFPIWSEQTSGMHQFAVWTMLEDEGMGASLQHYNPLIDTAVAQKWNLPSHWRLIAQMPFGNPIAQPAPKEEIVFSDYLIRII